MRSPRRLSGALSGAATSGIQERSPWSFAIAFACLATLGSVRPYLFLVLVALVPIAFVVDLRSSRQRRFAWSGAAALASSGLVLLASQGAIGVTLYDPAVLERLAEVRVNMGVGARTAFESRSPVLGAAAPTVAPPTATCASLPATTASSNTTAPGTSPAKAKHHVKRQRAAPYGAVEPAPTLAPTPTPQSGGGGSWPLPSPSATPSPAPSQSAPPVPSPLASLSLLRVVGAIAGVAQDLPRGLFLALLAPFPWQIGCMRDALAAPQMVLSYAALGASGYAAWVERRRWREWFLLASYVTAMLIALR